jgi:hypothetical protein
MGPDAIIQNAGEGRVTMEVIYGYGAPCFGINIHRFGRIAVLSKRQTEELYDSLKRIVDPQ